MPATHSSKQTGTKDVQQDPGQQQPTLQRQKAMLDRNQAQVGTLMRTTAKRDLHSDSLDERKQFLAEQQDAVVAELVEAASKKLTSNLSAKMGKVITAQKQKILEGARGAVKHQLDKDAHKGERGDLKEDALLADSSAWTDAATAAADEAKTLVHSHEGELANAADGAFKNVGPGVSLKIADRPKHLAKVKADAKKLIDARAKDIEIQLTAEANKETAKQQLVDAATGKAAATAKQGVKDEAEARHTADADVQTAVAAPVKQAADEIRTATKAYLEKGLGAHGTQWFRSAEFKNFHTLMKQKAREKGHEETDKELATKRAGVQDGHTSELEYQGLKAHTLTHDAAKMELREVMTAFAGDLLSSTDKEINPDGLLKTPATAAAWAALRKDPAKAKSKTAAAKAAVGAVKAAKPGVLQTFHNKAQELKNGYVKAVDPKVFAQKTDEVVDHRINPALTTKGKDGEKFGQRMVKQAMEVPTAGKGLQLVGKLIDAACPQVGDETELEVELKIPATHGAFCYFTVTGSAQRSAHMELGIDIAFGAGWETWGLSARGGFKVFLKAAAADTVNAMQLIHYGAFRNLTHASNDAANFWAGVSDPKKTAARQSKQVGKTEQAELWAAMTEERVFGKDKEAFVEVGGGVGASASLKAGIEAEGSAELTSARRWDMEVFNKMNEAQEEAGIAEDDRHGVGTIGGRKAGDDRDTRKAAAQGKRKLVSEHAKRVNRFQFGTSVTAEVNGQKFALGVEATRTAGEGWEIELTGGIPYDPSAAGSSTLTSKIAGAYVPAALSGLKKIHDAYKAKQDKSGDPKAQIGGGVVDAGEDAMIGLDAGSLTGGLLKKLSEANPQNMEAEHADGINDTARLWLGKSMGMKGAMGEHGDMSQATSEVEAPQPFGATSSLEVALMIEIPFGGTPKWAFKVSKSKELKMGADLGAGLGLSAKLTRKQELGGVAGEGLSKPRVFSGGREDWVANNLGGGGHP